MFLMVSGMAFMNLFFFRDFKIYQNKKKMIDIGTEINESLKTKTIDEIRNEIFALSNGYNVMIRIIDSDCNVILDNIGMDRLQPPPSKNSTRWFLKEHQKEILAEGYFSIKKVMSKQEDSHLLYARKLPDGYYLMISRTLRSIDEDIETSNLFLILTGSTLVIFGTGIIYLMAKRFTKPILQISDQAKAIASLDFSERVNVKSKDEIGLLADSMNEISEQLSESINQLKKDINQRKQLVRDMSHELKTPITSIKGYTEALKFGVIKEEGQIKQYYEVIVNECDRMNDIIHEMLELSKMDNVVNQLQMEKFEVSKLVDAISEQFLPKMNEKRIKYQVVAEKHQTIEADYHLLLRAVKNLIENGVRYTNVQGTLILTINQQKSGLYITVYNSGSQIPKEQQDSIFEVFYKGDPSRKRNSNTYGIGLAIVKSIMELHQGTVSVKNMPDGVEFQLVIPQGLHPVQ